LPVLRHFHVKLSGRSLQLLHDFRASLDTQNFLFARFREAGKHGCAFRQNANYQNGMMVIVAWVTAIAPVAGIQAGKCV
jgi:hypothetical protein